VAYEQQARVYQKSANKGLCRSCCQRDFIIWKCEGCGTATSRGYTKCKRCSHKGPELPDRFCSDCGVTLKADTSLLCLPCHNKNQNKGLSRARTLFNVSASWAKVRTACFERDDYTCQECEVRGGKLHAHHIKSYRDHAELRLDVANLLTVCEPCHMAMHGLTRAALL
jgi:5-methylcytosine-specific restriction endonuclease McrA